MRKQAIIIAVSTLLACQAHAKDKAPEITDINNIVVDGQTYTAKKFMDTFCMFPKAEEDKNCFLASKKANKDMSKYRELDW